jgi:E3 ubiquitin-protein ligase synoviolin
MTTRSFIKRLGALLRYRQALRDMNAYPDATAEELGRENTCIICREEMRPWDPSDSGQVERTRPKKLPCGHILHYGCLKSWLERQQVCPTCRRSVVVNASQQGAPAAQGNGMVFRFGLNLPGGAQNQPPPANVAAPAPQGGQGQAPPPVAAGGNDQNQQPRGNAGVRMFNFGPIRLGFAQGGAQDIQEMARRLGLPNEQPAGLPPPPQLPPPAATQSAPPGQFRSGRPVFDAANSSLENIQGELANISVRVQHDIELLRNTQAEMHTLNLLVQELNRIRRHGDILDLVNQQRLQQETMAAAAGAQAGGPAQVLPQPTPTVQLPPNAPFPAFGPFPQVQPFAPFGARQGPPNLMTRHTAADGAAAIPAGSADLPEGVSLPPGWSLLPLQRMGGQQQAAAGAVNGQPPQNGMPPASQPLSRSNGTDPQRPPSTNAVVDEAISTVTPSTQATTEQVNAGSRSGLSPVTIPGSDLTVPRPTEDESISALYAQPDATSTAGLPNWGGSAQLFAMQRTATPTAGPSESVTTSQASSGLQSSNGGARTESPAVAEEHTAAAGQNGADGDSVDNGKGKSRAVTVEESADEEG